MSSALGKWFPPVEEKEDSPDSVLLEQRVVELTTFTEAVASATTSAAIAIPSMNERSDRVRFFPPAKAHFYSHT